MENIKFRAWHKYSKGMIKGISHLYDSDYEYMQYTGLKDRNGIEIYEGDIVTAKPDYIGEIIFESIDFKGCTSTSFVIKHVDGGVGGIGKVEVIGNKFENPELLASTSGCTTQEIK